VIETTDLEEYASPSSITEAEIVAAYRRSSEARPCVCGGVVVADPADPAPGVVEHHSDPRHVAWRDWVGL
jgi:hypothetical protein